MNEVQVKMKYHVKALEGCARLLEIRAEERELEEAREKVFHDFERVARIPGFRAGKAPRALVVKHYAKEAREELLKRMIPELYDQALEASHLKAVGFPEISDVQFEDLKLSFKAKVETKPEISLRRYKGLKVTRKSVAVDPDEVQKSLRSIQEDRSELVPKEGVVEEEDFVVCDLEGRFDGKAAESRKNVLVQVTFKEQKHPEFVKALLGAKRGDSREAEFSLESPGGVVQKARYQIRVNEVKKKILPEMNDALVRNVSRFQTLKELEEALSQEIRKQKEREAQKQIERQLLDQLQGSSSFEVPQSLVEKELHRISENEAFRLKLLGWPDQEIQGKIGENKEIFLKEAESRVRNSLILEKIAEMEKIEVAPGEIDERIHAVSAQLKRSDKEEREDLTNETLRRRIAGEILFDKALEVVVSNAEVKEVS